MIRNGNETRSIFESPRRNHTPFEPDDEQPRDRLRIRRKRKPAVLAAFFKDAFQPELTGLPKIGHAYAHGSRQTDSPKAYLPEPL